MTKLVKNRLINSSLYMSYGIIVLFFVFPLFWVLSLSLKSIPQLFASPPVLFPTKPQFENYLYVIQNTSILRYLMNSFIIVLSTIVLVLLIAIPAAYAFSRMKFRYKNFTLLAILIFQMISPVVVAIPLYRFFVQFDLLNNYASLIAVYVAVELPIATWFLRGYFETIPIELDEAATIDGCSRLQVVRKILLPVCGPGIASVTILVGVQSWSQFVVPFILLDDNALYPVSMGLVDLQSTTESITTHYLAAASMIGIIPVIIVFILLQRYIVGALTGGAVKG